MSLNREQRIEMLRQAARARHQAATRRAEEGLRQLTRKGEPVTFRSVARAGNVSLDFLYREDQLRARIQRLRDQQNHRQRSHTQPDRATADGGNVVTTLTIKLRHARQENQELRRQLAVAHGELLALRRAARASAPAVRDDSPVTDPSVTC